MSFLQRTDFTQSCITLSLKNRESTGIVQFCEYAWAEWLHKIKKNTLSTKFDKMCYHKNIKFVLT